MGRYQIVEDTSVQSQIKQPEKAAISVQAAETERDKRLEQLRKELEGPLKQF